VVISRTLQETQALAARSHVSPPQSTIIEAMRSRRAEKPAPKHRRVKGSAIVVSQKAVGTLAYRQSLAWPSRTPSPAAIHMPDSSPQNFTVSSRPVKPRARRGRHRRLGAEFTRRTISMEGTAAQILSAVHFLSSRAEAGSDEAPPRARGYLWMRCPSSSGPMTDIVHVLVAIGIDQVRAPPLAMKQIAATLRKAAPES